MSYRAVLFDLFDTLVHFERSRLPEVQVDGRTIRSTAGRLHEVLHPHAPAVGLADFVGALLWSWQEAERVRNETHREVPAPERFGWLFRRLGLDPGTLPAGLLPALLETHMRELARAAVFPPGHGALLAALRPRYRLAVVSNFDWTPTARFILERERVAGLFDAVVVSDEVGWRKPAAVIFETALGRLGVPAAEALFVGDRPDIDVAGALGAGLRAAWLNRAGEALPEGLPRPHYEVRDLGELGPILGIPADASGI